MKKKLASRESLSSRGRKPAVSTDERGKPALKQSPKVPFQSLAENLDVGIAVVSTERLIHFANPRFSETLSIPAHHVIVNSDLRNYFSQASWESLDAALLKCANGSVEGEMKVGGPEQTRVVRLCFHSIATADEPLIGVLATEVTELVEKRSALVESEASLRSLSARILQLQDEERRRISRDLHDVVGQEVAALSMGLNRLAKEVGPCTDSVQDGFEGALAQVKKLEEGIRTLSYLLHPPLLDELGLGSALHWYIEGFAKRSGIQVEAAIAADAPRFDLDAETALFRIVQESLANVLRHSGSRKAKVSFSVNSGVARIEVQDEGKGIAPHRLRSASNPTASLGVGIPGMRQRLQQIGGALQVRPRNSGPGTQVVATLPVVIEGESSSQTVPSTVADISRAAESTPKPASQKTGRILIADDHEVTRHGIRALLSSEPGLEICGEAQDGIEAVTKARELMPDIVLMDLYMPGASGFAAANQIKQMSPAPKVLIFTSHSVPGLEKMIRLAGLSGFVFKSDTNQDLVRAVRAVLQGEPFYNPEMARSKAV